MALPIFLAPAQDVNPVGVVNAAGAKIPVSRNNEPVARMVSRAERISRRDGSQSRFRVIARRNFRWIIYFRRVATPATFPANSSQYFFLVGPERLEAAVAARVPL